jgi:hypothetical protein
MEEETVIVKEDKPKVDLVIAPYRDAYTITWVDGNEYDVVINESGIYWTKKSQISQIPLEPLEENILNE